MKYNTSQISTLIYGIICYLTFLISFISFIAFVDNILLPKTLDSVRNNHWQYALFNNLFLLLFFLLQHSGMAREQFKQQWIKIIPPTIERSTYVLLSSLCLIIIIIFWQPIGVQIWQIYDTTLLYILYSFNALGWLLTLASSFSINHFDLFGLRQVFLYFQGKEYTNITFKTPAIYQIVRHPLYLGFLLGIWSTPSMTISHLIFALVLSIYILVAIQWEEKDLLKLHGESYSNYKKQVPMLMPRLPRQPKT